MSACILKTAASAISLFLNCNNEILRRQNVDIASIAEIQ
jgi:hypothetical protein